MAEIRFGSTGIVVEQNGFGALPIQRVDTQTAVSLIKRAYEGACASMTAPEAIRTVKKAWYSTEGIRENVIIATKTLHETRRT